MSSVTRLFCLHSWRVLKDAHKFLLELILRGSLRRDSRSAARHLSHGLCRAARMERLGC